MSNPANRTQLASVRPLAAPGGGGLRGPNLAPLPPKQEGRVRRWLFWFILALVGLAGLTYLLGRTVEPVRLRLAKVPVVGQRLFAAPVWPILWNRPQIKPAEKPASTPPGAATGTAAQPGAAQGSTSTPPTRPEYKSLEESLAARLAAAEAKEMQLKEREAAIRALESELVKQQERLNTALKETEALRVQLAGQLKTELDRVEIIRAMPRSQQTAQFSALTDDEAVTILKYMSTSEVGKILATMDPYRSARILYKLNLVVPAPTETAP